MITYHHNGQTTTLTRDQAIASLASLESPTQRVNTPQAIRNRKAEAMAIRNALALAPMGNVVSVITSPACDMAFSETAIEMHALASEYVSNH